MSQDGVEEGLLSVAPLVDRGMHVAQVVVAKSRHLQYAYVQPLRSNTHDRMCSVPDVSTP